VVGDNNRRHGMAICSVDGMIVRDSTFKNATGFFERGAWANGFGIDIEPNAGQTVTNLTVTHNTFTGNAATALSAGANSATAIISNILLDGNTITGNGTAPTLGTRGIWVVGASGIVVTGNILQDNFGLGIQLVDGVTNSLVCGNIITGTRAKSPVSIGGGQGILLLNTGGNTIHGNSVTNNQGCGLRDALPSGVNTITGNTNTNNGGPCS